jgi:SAM-dependent methyltransferase
MESKSVNDVKVFWQDAARAEVDAQGLRPTARDPYLQLAVEDIVEQYLEKTASLLDIGCGDGLSTLRFSERVRHVTGVDYIDGFVERARLNAAARGVTNAVFQQGDVTDLGPIRARHGMFDVVVSIRCLINLPTWELQQKGLGEIAECVRPGGLFLCSEGWLEGWEGLNGLRAAAGLEPVQIVPYNKLIPRGRFEALAQTWFEPVGHHGLGLYLFMSRVVQPYLVRPQAPSHTHPLNKAGQELQRLLGGGRFGDCDYAAVLVFRRKTVCERTD